MSNRIEVGIGTNLFRSSLSSIYTNTPQRGYLWVNAQASTDRTNEILEYTSWYSEYAFLGNRITFVLASAVTVAIPASTQYYVENEPGSLSTGTARVAGTVYGAENKSIVLPNMPNHYHRHSGPGGTYNYADGSWNSNAIINTYTAGGGKSFDILNPCLGIHFIIKT
jgi:hypothetical protein